MRMTRIVVLANSWKHHDWCIAGIDLDTGKWIRPVTRLDDGRIPRSAMKLDAYFPELLDVLEIPLDSTGPDFGFESENRTIMSGRWRHRGTLSYGDLRRFYNRCEHVLHNHHKYVTLEEMQAKPFEERSTLQLMYTDKFRVRDARKNTTDRHNWKGVIVSGGREMAATITDPVFFGKLDRGEKTLPSCLLTMSLSMPYKPANWGGDREAVFWKLIAGVIEVPQ